MLNIRHLRERVIRPVLTRLDAYSPSAENLLVGTAVQESTLIHLVQLGGGPGLGLYQMEPGTEEDIWINYFPDQKVAPFRERVRTLLVPDIDRSQQLIWNLAYATAMCRAHYRRVKEGLPRHDDVDGLAYYWKRYYNTTKGDGSEEQFRENYTKYVIPAGGFPFVGV